MNENEAAVLHCTRSVAGELARYDIRSTAVRSGLIETAMTDRWYSNTEREALCQRTAFGRGGDPDEVASCVAFRASEVASYVTGRAKRRRRRRLSGGFVPTLSGSAVHRGSERCSRSPLRNKMCAGRRLKRAR
ncbi:SDR family oxidoreductase [Salinadaptatus halalkaliphilus]|uniref:SDR family oxidoreductase n=1 Tax=Salinadaptatus halalkaliphilus TaxID=2419781 RepID=UPI00319E4F12